MSWYSWILCQDPAIGITGTWPLIFPVQKETLGNHSSRWYVSSSSPKKMQVKRLIIVKSMTASRGLFMWDLLKSGRFSQTAFIVIKIALASAYKCDVQQVLYSVDSKAYCNTVFTLEGWERRTRDHRTSPPFIVFTLFEFIMLYVWNSVARLWLFFSSYASALDTRTPWYQRVGSLRTTSVHSLLTKS